MMKSVALAFILLLPDRLPSLIVLVGFWIPPAVAGWVAAEFLQRRTNGALGRLTVILLAIFVLGYAAAWFFFNLGPHAAVHSRSVDRSNIRAAESRRESRRCRDWAGVARQHIGVRAGISPP